MTKIKNVTGDSITSAVDAISEADSQRISAESLSPAGGKIILVQYPKEGATDRKNVILQRAYLPLRYAH